MSLQWISLGLTPFCLSAKQPMSGNEGNLELHGIGAKMRGTAMGRWGCRWGTCFGDDDDAGDGGGDDGGDALLMVMMVMVM